MSVRSRLVLTAIAARIVGRSLLPFAFAAAVLAPVHAGDASKPTPIAAAPGTSASSPAEKPLVRIGTTESSLSPKEKIAVSKTFLYLPVIGYITIEYVFLLTVPVYAAILYGYRGQGYRAIGKAVLWMIPSAFIAFRIPNIMTTAVLMLSYMIILGIAVFHGWFHVSRRRTLAGIAAALLCAPAAGIAFYWFMGEDYQRERLRVILDPGSTEAGYVPGLIRGLIENSRLAGSGATVPDTSVIPQFQTFILSGVTVYYGMLAAAVLAGLILFLLIRFLRISLRQRNQLGMLMGAGCSVVFLVETAVYILNNLGVVYTSSYCPFLSYGGTGTLITYILLGILLSICRYQNTAPERKRLPGISRKPV